MKSDYKKASPGKKLLQLAAALFFLLLPVMIVWSAKNNLQNQVRNTKLNAKMAKLEKLLAGSEPVSNPFIDIFHDFNHIIRDLYTNPGKLQQLLIQNKLNDELKILFKNLSQRFDYPVEVSACCRMLPDAYEQFSYTNDLATAKNRLTEFTRLMYLVNSGGNSEEAEEELIREFGREVKQQGLIFLDRHFLTGGEESFTPTFIRSENRLELLLSARRKGFLAINALFDLSLLNEKSRILKKVKRFNESDAGIVFFNPQTSEQYSSKWLNNKNGLVIRAMNKISSLPEKTTFFQLDNYLVVVSAKDSQLKFRAMICSEIPPIEPEEELELLLALFAIFSLFLGKTIIESIVFAKPPRVSIKFFILNIFMIICLLPLVGAVYLAGEHVTTMFKLVINETSAQMSANNSSLDLQTLDNFRQTLHLLKSLDSVEKLRKFSGASDDDEIGEVVIKTLNLILHSAKQSPVKAMIGETWVFDTSENLDCYEYHSDKNIYRSTDFIDPFMGDLFKQKFKDFMKSQKVAIQKKQNNAAIEVDELKTEMLNEIFLNVFGPKTYFEQKKDIGHLLELKTQNDRNFFYSMPVTENGKIKYILSHIFDSHSMRNHFPFERLQSEQNSGSFVIYGWDEYLLSRPQEIEFYSENFPEALELAKESHLTKFKLEQQIAGTDNNMINIAQPARFSDFIIAASERAPHLLEMKTRLVNDVARITAMMVALMTLLAMVVAQFFQAPINELTRATNEIIEENYQIRINSWHPDEFYQIGKTFNHMARQLEEGKLLSTFVAESLASELDSTPAAAQRKQVSVLFSGITSFKNHPDQKDPEKLFKLLQVHLGHAAAVAAEFAGEIDKMIEDKVMIVFEDRGEAVSSKQRAIFAARRLVETFSQETGQALSLGLNSGEVVSGIMGSEKFRLAKTVVGDPVNLAARLAAIAESHGGGIVVSAQSLADLNETPAVKKLDITTVKGKTQSVEIFSVILDS